MSTGVAHADPRFALGETQARAGETVHFSISKAKGRFQYSLAVGELEVLHGIAVAKVAAGQFTMPDLGAAGGNVTVDARIEERGETTLAHRKLEYLPPLPAPAAAVVEIPAAPAPLPIVAAPIPAPPAQPASEPAPSPTVPGAPTSATGQAERSRALRPPRQAGTPAIGGGDPSTATRRHRGDRSTAQVAKTGRGHAPPRTAPLFDGVPEAHGPRAVSAHDGFHALNAISPPAGASISSPGAEGSGGLDASILVPAMLALAALGLTATAVTRRRRLAAG